LAFAAILALAGCADIDQSLFGSSEEAPPPAQASANQYPDNGAGAPVPTAGSTGTMAGTLPAASSGTISGALSPTITPIAIEPGTDTGTAVNKTIQSLRGTISDLETRIATNAQRLSDLRTAGAESANDYQTAKAHITTRLQVGTTRGNPELVSEWNVAQSALDTLSGNINALNALGTDITNDSSTAHFALNQINATFDVSGAVDEDHRQLSVLEDETNQTIVLIDRLLGAVSADIQRQTAYVANERGNLTTLASSIKDGELYGPMLGGGGALLASNGGAPVSMAYSGTPLVVIRFDHPDVDYQQILYAALTQALQSRPNAGFSVVAVSPTRGTAAAVQLAQSAAERHAQDVLRSMTDMGVPATRLAVASATDPAATSTEVRVFVR
jgi:uncharacterized phage infection (PIP) family protein YhgE